MRDPRVFVFSRTHQGVLSFHLVNNMIKQRNNTVGFSWNLSLPEVFFFIFFSRKLEQREVSEGTVGSQDGLLELQALGGAHRREPGARIEIAGGLASLN